MHESSIRIIIPCYNADDTIALCLDAVFKTENVLFEVVIVDDGENCRIYELQNIYAFNIIRMPEKNGAGAARNAGAKGFQGDMLVFIDADVCINRPVTVETLIKPIREKKAIATVGRYSHCQRTTFFETYKHLYLAYTYGKNSGHIQNTFWSALCAVDTKSFHYLGGFPECYSGAGPEDIDFGIMLTQKKLKVMQVPEAEGTHLASMGLIDLIKNDLRKGSEDTYIHWIKKIPLTNNRHVEWRDILAVTAACFFGLSIFLSVIHGPMLAIIFLILYLVLRTKMVRRAFAGNGYFFLIKCMLMTYVLDIVRAMAIIVGTFFFALEQLSGGRWRPFRYSSLN